MDSLETTGTTAPEQTPTQPDIEAQAPTAEVPTEEASTEASTEATEEAPAKETPAEEATTEETPAEETSTAPLTILSIVERLREIVSCNLPYNRHEMDHLRITFTRLRDARQAQARHQFEAQGGQAADYVSQPEPLDDEYRQLMQVVRQRRAKEIEALEHEKQVGLARKLDILAAIQQLITTPEEASKHFDEFKNLTIAWKDVKAWPVERSTELWKSYELYTEQFYDLLKMGHELREYDFRKNLETKTRLCEQAEALASVKDVVEAMNQLLQLHQEWKETGPVAKELRDELWDRFKDASSVVRKHHLEHFEQKKQALAALAEQKEQICQELEAIDGESITQASAWTELAEHIKALQAKWRTIGNAGKSNQALYERFSAICQKLYLQRNAFWDARRKAATLCTARKKEIVALAEELKTSNAWRATTEQFSQLRREWFEISKGLRRRAEDEALYKTFDEACQHFFEQRKQAKAGDRQEEKQHLKEKKTIIQALEQLHAQAKQIEAREIVDKLRQLQLQWNATGHISSKLHAKLNQQFRTMAEEVYQISGAVQRSKKVEGFKQSIAAKAARAVNTLVEERKRVMEDYDRLKAKVLTYENNLGFLSINSKKGNSMAEQMQKRLDDLHAELDLMAQKVRAVEQEIKKSKATADKPKEAPAEEAPQPACE